MEASGSQAKVLAGRVTIGERSADVPVEVLASRDRVELSTASARIRFDVRRADLLVALGVTEAEVRDL